MGKHHVFSYRLTVFDGKAPCYDGDFLSLAICKVTMRRVIAREYAQNPNDTYWFIGIVGNTLAKMNSDFKNRENEILYVAKVTSVMSFERYFSNEYYTERKDQIYQEEPENNKKRVFMQNIDGLENQKKFCHRGENYPHEEENAWITDWDIKNKDGRYVLCSNQYSFIHKASKSQEVLENAGLKLAKSRQYTRYDGDNERIISELERLIKNGEGHGKSIIRSHLTPNCQK